MSAGTCAGTWTLHPLLEEVAWVLQPEQFCHMCATSCALCNTRAPTQPYSVAHARSIVLATSDRRAV